MLITSLGHRIIVRYVRRKPIWMPTAPSKLFRIHEHNLYSEEETKKIRLLDEVHKAQEASIREYMKHEFYIPATQSGGIPDDFIKVEQIDDQAINEENNETNARIAKLKAEYFANRVKELEDKVLEEKLAREDKIIETNQKISEYVSLVARDPNAFVTPENIEAKIDEAMEKTICYEFYIDLQGRKHGNSDVKLDKKHQEDNKQ